MCVMSARAIIHLQESQHIQIHEQQVVPYKSLPPPADVQFLSQLWQAIGSTGVVLSLHNQSLSMT
jgi:hypothetical protein